MSTLYSEAALAARMTTRPLPDQPMLAQLREEVDRLDDELLSLIAARRTVVARIAEAKEQGAGAYRPDREAQLIDRLLARNPEAPPALVWNLWREIMADALSRQEASRLVVHSNRRAAELTEAARYRFGFAAPLEVTGCELEALGHAASAGTLAVLDLDAVEPWWGMLAERPALAVVAAVRGMDGRLLGLTVARRLLVAPEGAAVLATGPAGPGAVTLASLRGVELNAYAGAVPAGAAVVGHARMDLPPVGTDR